MPEISGMIQNYLEGQIKTIAGEPVIQSKTINENGTYTAPEGVDGYNPVIVNVPAPEPVIEPKNIFANGEYTAPEGVDGYSPIIVDVPSKIEETLNVTSNGTYRPESGKVYNAVIVNVPAPEPVIEPKSIFANGEYTAPSGVDGYSPITVNVPLPQNAYLLKSVANLPQAIASFNDGQEMVMSSLKVAIEPQQEGSGDPSPTNIRPISGWDKCNVTVADDIENSTISNVYAIDLDGIRYGGEVDIVNGVLTVDRGMLTLNGSEAYYSIQSSSVDDNTVLRVATGQVCKQNENQKSNYGTYNNNAWHPLASRVNTFVLGSEGNLYLQTSSSTASTVEEFKALFASNPLQVCYELTTPITIQLTPTAVKSLRGVNNVYANTGNITDAEYFSKEE